jgi:hypothetical protein
MTDRTNKPMILMEFSRADASYIMDLLHADWARRVALGAATHDSGQYDDHVQRWLKRRPSRLMNYMDDTADKQGFWEDGKGL